VPAYAPALGHLAEVDAALGALNAAIDRLRPLAVSSDDMGGHRSRLRLVPLYRVVPSD
jgi:hypothetical protein